MKKIHLQVFILVDLAVMAAAGYVLYLQVMSKPAADAARGSVGAFSDRPPVAAKIDAARSDVSTSAAAGWTSSLNTVVAPSSAAPGMRRILFSFSNAKAKQVSLRADFTGWKAEAMRRDARGVWTYQANLIPGEYAYIFTMDDKPIRDPANKRTKRIGTTQVSAILVKPVLSQPTK